MRPLRVVASAALIAALASVAVPASVGSYTPSVDPSIAPGAFSAVSLDLSAGTASTTAPTSDSATGLGDGLLPMGGLQPPDGFSPTDPLGPSDVLGPADALVEPGLVPVLGPTPPGGGVPAAKPLLVNAWIFDPSESWYGPGFYGKRTACGEALTQTLLGVANRTLPCGTLVSFRNPYNGRVVTVPVVDRGPYVAGRLWDMTYATCSAIGHCWTGPLEWRLP